MVVNGACKHKDMAHFQRYMQDSGLDVQVSQFVQYSATSFSNYLFSTPTTNNKQQTTD